MDKRAHHFIVTMAGYWVLIGAILLPVGSAAHAQTTAAIDPSLAAVQHSGNDDLPPGGCMPIGVSASGEVIFPFLCKGFLERHGGMVAQPKPAAPEEQKPAAVEGQKAAAPEGEKPAEKPSEDAAPVTATRSLTTSVASATSTEEASQLTEDQLSLDQGQRRDVQQRLINLGFKTMVTGTFAEKTRAMIKRWQASRGFPATGYLNELQHKALLSRIAATLDKRRAAR